VQRSLIAQLTGRSANLLLLDKDNRIVTQLREGQGAGQTVGETYKSPPAQQSATKFGDLPITENLKSISEWLDQHYLALTARQASESRLASARAQVRKEISRRKKLLKQLENDLSAHAGAEDTKRIGDLLLANVSTAKRRGHKVTLTDYFADHAPSIEIEIDENLTLTEEASRRFESYARSKRARKQIAARIEETKKVLAKLEAQSSDLENNPLASDLQLALTSESKRPSKAAQPKTIPGTRRYMSSDGFEVLVGRAARDNDNLTFKIAKPNDLWLHAADYPGSHVVVRNPTRKEIPHRTLIEAAQLAAHFSRANKDPKVDVHYTQRKFLSKPKAAAPGLVRLQRFKSITVAPLEVGQRVK
jgi:predicted ribosome quality control (RQC) complex YloA/Tae2 family protein